MGLKKQNYIINGLELPLAYAKIGNIEIIEDTANVEFKIHTSRENLNIYEPIVTIKQSINFNRNNPLYEQLYRKSKEDYFKDWEDDIIP